MCVQINWLKLRRCPPASAASTYPIESCDYLAALLRQ